MFLARIIILTSFITTACAMDPNTIDRLRNALQQEDPFYYNLDTTVYPAKDDNADVMVYLHSSSGNSTELASVYRRGVLPHHLVTFNMPDANCTFNSNDTLSFGTIEELLPALYIIKTCVVGAQVSTIHVCGFSAGGGALINLLKILNTSKYDDELAHIGITTTDKQTMLAAIQRGHVILHCPLRSVEEVIAFRGSNEILEKLAHQYDKHDLRPIDSACDLEGLKLTLILHFQINDEILSNRDDKILYFNLSNAIATAQGKVVLIVGNDGGHNAPYHASLWHGYQKFVNTR